MTEVSATHLLYTFLIYPILFALTNYRNLHCILGRLNSLSERIHIVGIEVDKFFCHPNLILKILKTVYYQAMRSVSWLPYYTYSKHRLRNVTA